MKTNNYYLDSFFWSTVSTFVRSLVNFFTIPILLNYLGIDNYGILSLALSTNAYIAMMDIGGNTGPVKFFSEWFSQKNYRMVSRVAGTSITFYILFGVFNAIVLLVLAFFGHWWFKLTPEQFNQYKIALFIIAFFAIFNWCSHVLAQLITALERNAFISKVSTAISLLGFGAAIVTVWLKLSLNSYFFLYTLIQSLTILPYYRCLKSPRNEFVLNLHPQTQWKDFGIVLKYSAAVFSMGVFQALAARSRPIILGLFSNNAASVLGEYKVIEVFPSFLISICGALILIFLPRSSKFVYQNDRVAIERMAYEGSKVTSIFSCLICYPIIINAVEILIVYIGEEYVRLAKWMILWCFTLLLNLYNSPISSLVLAIGKTRMLVYSSAIACVVSMIINCFLCQLLNVGAAVVGYLVYIIIQQLFYFLYFDNKVMGLNSLRVLKAFGLPVLGGLIISLLITFPTQGIVNLGTTGTGLIIAFGFLKGVIWVVCFMAYLHFTRIMTIRDMLSLVIKK